MLLKSDMERQRSQPTERGKERSVNMKKLCWLEMFMYGIPHYFAFSKINIIILINIVTNMK